jgi:hypothetical protein
MLRNHLRPVFDDEDLIPLARRPEAFERYASEKLDEGLSPKTVRNHLVLLGLMFKPRGAGGGCPRTRSTLWNVRRFPTRRRRRFAPRTSRPCSRHIANLRPRPMMRIGSGTRQHVG